MNLSNNSPEFNSSDSPDEKQWPREQFPGLHMGADEYAAYKARESKKRELLELLGDDIIAIALAVAKEVFHGKQ
jgi:hypothetical protein